MVPDPLHPAVVHFPIVLALLLPLIALAAIVVLRRRASPRPVWAGVILVAVLLAVSSWASVRTGEADEEIVEEALSEGPIESHEEDGERFLLLSGVLTVIMVGGVVKGRYGTALRYVGLAASILVAGSAVATGHSGGALVYEHGAAEAHTRGASSTKDDHAIRGDPTRGTDRDDEDDDDDDDDDDD